MLELRDVEVRYGDTPAVSGVSLRVGVGEAVTLVGRNGAGKTTTLHAIAGLLPVTRGWVRFGDTDLAEVPPHRRVGMGMSLVPEHRALWPGLSVRENLELGAYPSAARRRRRVNLERVLALFPQLAERVDQPAGTLSGGEQQMTAIGRALMSDPKLLLLDEPSLGLSPVLTHVLLNRIRKLHEGGLTVLLAEQNLEQSLELAGRGYVLEDGRIRHQGAGEALLHLEEVGSAFLGV